jgi:hypothetical protein
MISSKLTKTTPPTSEERLFKLLEGIDWKLWEMYNMMKDNLPEKTKAKKTNKTEEKTEE